MGRGRDWTEAVGCPCLHPLFSSFNLWQRARVSLAALSSSSLDKRHFIRAKACRCLSRPLDTRPLWVSVTERLIGEVLSEVTWPFCREPGRPDGCTLLSLWDNSFTVTSGTDQTALSTLSACLECRFVMIQSNGLQLIQLYTAFLRPPFILTSILGGILRLKLWTNVKRRLHWTNSLYNTKATPESQPS